MPEIGDGEVLVRVRATAINAADYRIMRADPFLVRLSKGLRRPRQQILGMDVAGIVEDIGGDVTRFQVGDEVFGDVLDDGMGGFAEYVAASERSLAAKPDGVSFDQAAAVPLAGITALQAIRDKGAVAPGTTVLVQGAGGGVGTFVVQIAKAMGATVTAVCGPKNTELMASFGADDVIDYTTTDFTTDFVAQGRRYDVIIGVNGHHPLGYYKRCLNPGGRYVMVGGTTAQLFAALLAAPVRFMIGDKTAGALTIDDARREGDLAELRDWVSSGRLTPVIDRVFDLRDAADAMRYVENGHVRGKVVLRVCT